MQNEIALLVLESAEKLGQRVDDILADWRGGGTRRIPVECPRFSSGEGKCIIQESIRDRDVFILLDVCNWSLTYQMFGQTNRMSPDDRCHDL